VTVPRRDALDGAGGADDPEFACATAERNAVERFWHKIEQYGVPKIVNY
jgi:hypothetical protein